MEWIGLLLLVSRKLKVEESVLLTVKNYLQDLQRFWDSSLSEKIPYSPLLKEIPEKTCMENMTRRISNVFTRIFFQCIPSCFRRFSRPAATVANTKLCIHNLKNPDSFVTSEST